MGGGAFEGPAECRRTPARCGDGSTSATMTNNKLFSTDLNKLNDSAVLQLLQERDLADRRGRDTFVRRVEADRFQRNLASCSVRRRAKGGGGGEERWERVSASFLAAPTRRSNSSLRAKFDLRTGARIERFVPAQTYREEERKRFVGELKHALWDACAVERTAAAKESDARASLLRTRCRRYPHRSFRGDHTSMSVLACRSQPRSLSRPSEPSPSIHSS